MIFTRSFTKVYLYNINEKLENTCVILVFPHIHRATEFARSIYTCYYKNKHIFSFRLKYKKVSVIQLILLYYDTRKLFFFFVLPKYILFVICGFTTNQLDAQILSLLILSKVLTFLTLSKVSK